MLTVKKLRRKPKHFRSFTGLHTEELEQLLAALAPVYEQLDTARKNQRERQRNLGAGPGFTLALPERLLMTLVYFRLYATQAFLSCLFRLDDSNVSREINPRMLPALMQVLPMPAREERRSACRQGHRAGRHA